MSQGALLDLVAKGAQDVYLTSKPQMTHFKKSYKRHTNFSKLTSNLNFEGTLDFGNKNICKIRREGDLLGRIYLKIKLQKLSNLFLTQKITPSARQHYIFSSIIILTNRKK